MSNRKMLLLYAGPYYQSSVLSSSDCQELVSNSGATEFVILSAHTFNYTKVGDKVLWANWVSNTSNIPDSVFGTTNTTSIATIREQMLKRISKYDQATSTYDPTTHNYAEYIEDIVELAEKLANADSSCKIWLGLPAILPSCQPAASCYNYYYKTYFYTPIKEALTQKGLWGNVEGFYYGTEDVVSWYTKFNTRSVSTQFDNVVVKGMKYVADLVHGDSKKFLWIPYYRDNTSLDTVSRVGNIVNKTNIFDIVILQPNEYFGSYRSYGTSSQQDLRNNVSFIDSCVSAQKMKTKSGSIVGSSKTSSTEIGFEMEINDKITSSDTDEAGKTYLQRYNSYVSTFGKYITGTTKRPCAFYFDTADKMHNSAVYSRIKSFFNSGT
jgi:hypothetical protein